jgi:hypothetical protein
MKNTIIIILTVATLTLSALVIIQWRKVDEQRNQNATLQAESEQQARQMADVKATEELSQKQRTEAVEQASRLAEKVRVQPPVPSTVLKADGDTEKESKESKNAFSAIAKMMDDPEMKKMMREQQKLILDQLYSPLVKQMKLTPEETEKFKEMMADNTVKNASAATSLMDGSTNRTERLAALSDSQKEFAQQLKDFLGEDRYKQYEEYQETAGERMQLNQLKQQLAGSDNSITDQQMEQLLGFMREEKKNVAANTGTALTNPQSDPAQFESLLTDEGAEKYLKAQETANLGVYERAKSVLTQPQLDAFKKYQDNQLSMARMGFTMARKFMSSEK